tara:strand:+ start:132 stop:500 length:369 start_codon:yes stop_codon:yes gene_type:complete
MNLKIFVDSVGRTIIGEVVGNTDTALQIKNPCTIFVQPNEQGQLQVQTVPMFFREFLTPEGRDAGTTWTFNKATIVDSDCADHLDGKLKTQYDTIITTLTAPDAQVDMDSSDEPEVVKLFDD